MKEEGPFDVLKEMMRIHLANRDVGEVSDKLRMIDRDMDTIFYAFRKLEEWKKGQEAECESLIRLLTTQLDSPTALDPIRRMHLVDRIQPTLCRIRVGMEKYLPVIFNSAGAPRVFRRLMAADRSWLLTASMSLLLRRPVSMPPHGSPTPSSPPSSLAWLFSPAACR